MLTQKRWRIVGGVCLAACGLMAWYGVRFQALRESPAVFLGYWGLFLVLFVIVLYCVVLDLRYIKAEHVIMSREVFRETLGDEEFRRALRAAQAKASQSSKSGEQDT